MLKRPFYLPRGPKSPPTRRILTSMWSSFVTYLFPITFPHVWWVFLQSCTRNCYLQLPWHHKLGQDPYLPPYPRDYCQNAFDHISGHRKSFRINPSSDRLSWWCSTWISSYMMDWVTFFSLNGPKTINLNYSGTKRPKIGHRWSRVGPIPDLWVNLTLLHPLYESMFKVGGNTYYWWSGGVI